MSEFYVSVFNLTGVLTTVSWSNTQFSVALTKQVGHFVNKKLV